MCRRGRRRTTAPASAARRAGMLAGWYPWPRPPRRCGTPARSRSRRYGRPARSANTLPSGETAVVSYGGPLWGGFGSPGNSVTAPLRLIATAACRTRCQGHDEPARITNHVVADRHVHQAVGHHPVNAVRGKRGRVAQVLTGNEGRQPGAADRPTLGVLVLESPRGTPVGDGVVPTGHVPTGGLIGLLPPEVAPVGGPLERRHCHRPQAAANGDRRHFCGDAVLDQHELAPGQHGQGRRCPGRPGRP